MAASDADEHGFQKKSPVLIYRLGSLGDTIVSLPCFHLIALHYSNRRRIVLTNKPVSAVAAPLDAILRNSGLIDSVIEYSINLRSFDSIVALRRQIIGAGSTTLIYLAADRGWFARFRDYLFFRWCGIREIIGLSLCSRYVLKMDSKQDVQPEVERLAKRLHKLGDIDLTDSKYWSLRLTEIEKRKADSLLQDFPEKFFVINMGGKVEVKDWGVGNWKKLVTSLGAFFPSMGLVVIGAAEDQERAAEVAGCWSHKSLNLCGNISPRESAAVLSLAKFFVGHDSGPLHLAAAMSVPCVGLFGSYNRPRQWHPYGKRHIVIHNIDGIHNISIEQVRRAVLNLSVSG